MRKIRKLLIVLLILSVVGLGGCAIKQDPVVAIVEGEKITESLYRVYLWDTQQFFESISGESIWEMEVEGRKTEDIAKESALKSAIRAILTEKKAKELSIELTKEETEKAKKRAEEFMVENEEVAQTFGFTQENIEKLFLSTFLTEKVQQRIGENYMPSEEEINEYIQTYKDSYEQVEVNYILLHTRDENNQPLPEAQITKKYELAKELLERALDGESVAELAKQYSEDTNADTGGQALIRRGDTVEEFEKVAFSLEQGRVYDKVLETPYGYHILEVKEHILADEEQMREEYIEREKVAFANSELEELFKNALIEKTTLYDEMTLIKGQEKEDTQTP